MKSKPAKQFLEDYLQGTDLSRDTDDVNPTSQLTEQIEDDQEGMPVGTLETARSLLVN